MKTILSAGALLLLFSCNQPELSKQEAATVIRSEKDYPKVYDFEINTADPAVAKRMLDAGMETNGLVIIDRTQKLKDIGNPVIHFTEKAKPFLIEKTSDAPNTDIQKVKLADMDLGEITGISISNENKTAMVNYTVQYLNVTPFSKLVKRELAQPEPQQASFVLYDTGWKIEKRK